MEKAAKPVLVFALTRRGCLPYTRQMLAFFPLPVRVYASAFAEGGPLPHSKPVTSYRNTFEFAWQSLWVLPRLLLRLRRDFRRSCKVAYFPVFHHWNLPIMLWCRLHGVKTLLTVHDSELHAGERRQQFDQWWQDRSMRVADEIIFLTEYARALAVQRLSLRGRSSVIPHGLLPLPGLEAPPDRVHAPLPRLLMLGRIGPYKGLELLYEALQNLPAGIIGGVTVAGLSHYAEPAPPPGVHRINRRLSEAEIAQLLLSHDILVLPYTEATQSGILTLGIRAAIPMVVTKVGGLSEQLGPDEAVWIAPSAPALSEGIARLARSPQLYEGIYHRLRLHAKDAGWATAAAALPLYRSPYVGER
ncbi:MAG: glycosyltransferase family 4 protein [Saprospiraceae bacterium]|nr:glycosyltransferase family 4 protein [Saprospiraceae bacterium]